MCLTLEFVEMMSVPAYHDYYLNILWDYCFQECKVLIASNTCEYLYSR